MGEQRTKRKIEKLERQSQSKHRESYRTAEDFEAEFDGDEAFVENADGSMDLLKRMGDRTVRLSHTLDGLEVVMRDGVLVLEIMVGGKVYKINFEC